MEELKKVSLLVVERLGIIRLFNEAYAQKGLDIIGLQRAGKIGMKCELTVKEKEDIDWKDLPQGGATLNAEKANKLEIEIEFSDSELDMIKEIIKAKSDAKSFTSSDMFIVGLMTKLGIDL